MTKKVLVTGAFGNVGQWALKELLLQDYNVIALELKNDRTLTKQQELATELTFKTIWADLTDEGRIKDIIQAEQPEIIVHIAAVIAPTAYVIPEVAYTVNVLGSTYLIEAAEQLENFDRFIFISSYTVHGPRNPHKKLKSITGSTMTNPVDNYGKHKVAVENRLERSTLNWIIIRLPAVFSTDADFGTGPEFAKFGLLLDPDRNQSAIDVRDAGLAIANAVAAPVNHRKFDICGDPMQGWTGTAREITGAMLEARGLSSPPDAAFRRADPEVDESWYCEDLIDPSEAQEILRYQRYSLQDYLDYIKQEMGFSRYFLKMASPFIKIVMLKDSSYIYKVNKIDSRPIWEAILEEFDIKEDKLQPTVAT